MKLIVTQPDVFGMPKLAVLEHRDGQINWNIGLFDKMSYSGTYDIFEQINGYWASIPMNVQDRIFETYLKIRELFDTEFDPYNLTTKLYPLVAELCDYHDLHELRHWIDFHSNVVIPHKLDDEFAEEDGSKTRDRTYLKEDYRWLVALSVAIRVMIPVWGEFVANTRKDTGSVFKEYQAYKLLAYSKLMKSDAMEKLRVYVEQSLPVDKSRTAAIYGGLSSEDFPIWMLGLVLVRKLSIGDVRGIDPNSSLVASVHKFAVGKEKSHETSFMGAIQERRKESRGAEDESNLSVLERTKTRDELPAGDVETLKFYLEDPVWIAKAACPEIPKDLVTLSMASTKATLDHRIWPPQITLMQWVLARAFPPKGLQYMDKKLILNAMAATQAILWYRGHHHLAAFVSAIEQTSNDEMLIGGSDSRSRIQKDQVEQLERLFPYTRKPAGKQRVSRGNNPGVEAIESICRQFSERDWRLTLPEDMVEVVTGNKANRRISVPVDFKVKLANLVITVANRSL